MIYKTLSLVCQRYKGEFKNYNYIKLFFDLFLVKLLESEGLVSQVLYFIDFSVLLYFMNDQLSLLNY